MHRSTLAAAATACVVALVLAGCGSDDAATDATSAAATSSAAGGDTGTADSITIDGAWARTSPAMAEAGAAYFTVTSAVADQLVGVAVDPSIAASAELHETSMSMGTGDTMTGDTMTGDTMTGDTAAPAMEMSPVDAIDLTPGTPVTFEPGGYHVMLNGLAAPLTAGQTFTLTLTFAVAGERDVTVTVADEAP